MKEWGREVIQRKSLTTFYKQTDAWPVSEQEPPWKPTLLSSLLLPLLPVFIAEQDIVWYELSP